MSGTGFAMLGGLVGALAIIAGSFAVFVLGCFAIGIAGAGAWGTALANVAAAGGQDGRAAWPN